MYIRRFKEMNKIKINLLFGILGALFFSLSLTSCNSNNETTSKQDTTSADVKKGVIATSENQYNLATNRINSDGTGYSLNLKYELFSDPSNYALVYQGSNSDNNVVIPDVYSDGTTSYNVTGIASNGFNNDDNLQTINWGANVNSIGDYAFAFCDNSNFTSITLPSGLTNIACGAFQNCNYLANVTYGDNSASGINITAIYDYAFAGDYNLSNISLPTGCVYYGSECFYKTNIVRAIFTAGTSDITIKSYAFFDCSRLACIFLPTNVKTIEDYAFRACFSNCQIFSNATNESALIGQTGATYSSYYRYKNNAEKITFYSGQVDSINVDDGGLYYYVLVTSGSQPGANILAYNGDSTNYYGTLGVVDIPDTLGGQSVVEIEPRAFEGHTEIVEIDMPNSLKTLKDYAFANISNLAALKWPGNYVSGSYVETNTLVTIGNYCFTGSGAKFNSALNIPYGVTTISQYAFQDFVNCTGLSFGLSSSNAGSINIIGNNVFQYLGSNLSSPLEITIPGSLTRISNNAFMYAKLSKVTISEPVGTFTANMTIGGNCFGNVTTLKEIHFNHDLIKLEASVFQNDINLERLYIPNSITDSNSSNVSSNILNGTYSCKIYFEANITNINNKYFKCGIYSNASAKLGEGSNIYSNVDQLTADDNNYQSLPFYTNVGAESNIKIFNVDVTTGGVTTSTPTFEYVEYSDHIAVTNYLDKYDVYPATSFEIPDTINSKTVTLIGGMFAAGTKIVGVKVGNSITKIAELAFWVCFHLTYFGTGTITAGGTCYFPTSCNYIGRGAFYDSGLSSVVLTYYASEYIGFQHVFMSNRNLTDISFQPQTGQTLPDPSVSSYYATNGCLYNMTATTDQTYNYNLLVVPLSLAGTLNVLSGTKTLSRACAKWTYNLVTLNVPDSVELIESYSFQGGTGSGGNNLEMSKLESVLMNKTTSSLTKIGAANSQNGNAFYDNRVLKRFDFPNSLVEIDKNDFYNCYALENFNSDTSSGVLKFYGTENKDDVENDRGHLTSIYKDAFFGCKKISTIFLPNSLTTANTNSFYSSYVKNVYVAFSRKTYTDKTQSGVSSTFINGTDYTIHYYRDETSGNDKLNWTIPTTGTYYCWYYSSGSTMVEYKYVNGVRSEI